MNSLPSLHEYHTHKLHAILQITHSVCHGIALAFIFYFRISFLLLHHHLYHHHHHHHQVHLLPLWVVLFVAEVLMSFIWLLKQPFYWWPVTRTVSPENLLSKEQQQQQQQQQQPQQPQQQQQPPLPGIDVFICTADPNREPTFEVMNTVISAMALDYPPHKLSVYLSDDANATVTLNAMKEAWVFATWWLPFVTKYNINTVCPRPYFEHHHQKDNTHHNTDHDFIQDRNILQEKYEVFKSRVRSKERIAGINGGPKTSVKDHPAFIQVINENAIEDDNTIKSRELAVMPSLIYVAREKRPMHCYHFKAGALNVLLRVSATMSNSPYILILDCDMYCNDSISAREAMCFYLDPKISPTLGWVQYPQTFHNVNENDIYNSRMREAWEVFWPGVNGLQGPIISGTNFYINRKALYGFHLYNGNDIMGAKDIFGASHDLFVQFILQKQMWNMPNEMKNKDSDSCSVLVQQALSLASCVYEENTQWGKEVGFCYKSVVEDAMTGLMLHNKGWRSVYLNPTKRPAFLGSATTNLNEILIQNSRWASGLIDIGLSKYFPLLYTPSKLHILQRISSSWILIFPLTSLPVWCFLTIPPIGFLYDIPLYPKASDRFLLAYAYVFISCLIKNLFEVLATIGNKSISTLTIVLNEERSWMIKSLTCHVYGVFDCIMGKLGLREATFIPTNKTEDKDTSKLYEMGKYDFRTSNMFLVPLVTMVSLNICCFVGGIARLITNKEEIIVSTFAQAFFSIYVFVVGFPIIEAMFLRDDPGCIPLLVTLKSTLFSIILLILGYLFLIC